MGKKRVYTISEVSSKTSLFRTALPFDITHNGEIIATVINPQRGIWRSCENCQENTQNIIEYKNKNLEWEQIILCDKCADELL